MPAKKTDATKPEPSFEAALARLEAIVEQMEDGKLPLEELIGRYEEGIKLVKQCSEKLAAAEQRIQMITKAAGGKIELADFEEQPETPAKGGASEASLF
jgi:exodeoxyribonuclease VII small subunit